MKKTIILIICILISISIYSNQEQVTKMLNLMNSNNNDQIIKMIENGADINAKDDFGNTILFYAAQSCNFKLVEILIKNGADVNITNNFGETPLFLAIIDINLKGFPEKLKIENFEKHFINNLTKNEIDYISQYYKKDKKNIQLITKFKKMDQNECAKLWNLFQKNVYLDSVKLVDILMQNGAKLNIKNNFNYTPIIYAAFVGNFEMIKYLDKNGENINYSIQINDKTKEAYRKWKKTEGIRYYDLPKYCFWLTIDDNNLTALDISRYFNHKNTYNYLLEKNVKSEYKYIEIPAIYSYIANDGRAENTFEDVTLKAYYTKTENDFGLELVFEKKYLSSLKKTFIPAINPDGDGMFSVLLYDKTGLNELLKSIEEYKNIEKKEDFIRLNKKVVWTIHSTRSIFLNSFQYSRLGISFCYYHSNCSNTYLNMPKEYEASDYFMILLNGSSGEFPPINSLKIKPQEIDKLYNYLKESMK